jgi:quinol monooxygenase YgiN
MGRIVVVGLKPKPGKEAELEALIKMHLPILREEGLATDRAPIVMRAEDGTIVEVFEWKSKEAINAAHSNTAVLAMWQKYSEVCEFVPVSRINEFSEMFSEFTPLD